MHKDALKDALTVPCPGCKMPADTGCVDPETGIPADAGHVHQARIYRVYVVAEALAHNRAVELAAALERLRVAAEQYLDTEHRTATREAELRRALGDAATDAALLLTTPETTS